MELFLVLFLLSGQFKAFLQFFGIPLPVDFTIVTAAIVVGLAVYKLLKKNTFNTNPVSFFGIGLLLLFYAWMIFSLFYSASEVYSKEKTFFFLLNILAFTVPFFYKEFNIRLFFKAFVVTTLILSLGLLPFQYFDLLESAAEPGKEGAYSAIGGLYLTLSEYLGLIVILLMTRKGERIFSKNLDITAVILILILMVLLGARGPILFVGIVYGLYYLSSIRIIRLTIKTKTILWLGIGAVVLVGTLFVLTRIEATKTLLYHSVYRFIDLANGTVSGDSQAHSAHVRILLIQDAFDGIFKNIDSFLFGYGIGSFGIISKGFDIRLYPHNMILEIWFELGLIGLLLFTVWVVFILLKSRQLTNSYISYWLLFYIFLNLMKSSSLIDIRTEFAVIALFTVQNFVVPKKMKPALA
jgi:O-antigen ligase